MPIAGARQSPAPRHPAKPGRNDSCPCGSGRKYKNCCAGRQRASLPGSGLDRALAALGSGNFAEAIAWIEALPDGRADPRALYLLGRAQKAMGDMQAAAENYRAALLIDPRHADALVSLGIVLRAQGLLEEAASSYARAVELDPRTGEAWINLGNVRLDQHRLEAAQACFQRALELQPRSWVALHRLGFVRHCHKDLMGAVERYQQALAINPAGVDCLVHLGHALEQMGAPAEAMRCYDHALAARPGSPAALYAKAGLLKVRGDLAQADALLSQAFEALPADVEQTYQLGAESFMLGRFHDAAVCYRRVLDRQARHAMSWVGLGECQRLLGELPAALDSFQRAIELQPALPDAYHGLGSVQLRLGRVAAALDAFRHARALDPMLVEAHSAELLTLNYLEEVTPAQIKSAHEQFYEQHFGDSVDEQPDGEGSAAERAARKSTRRKLRVGLLSPDFRRHAVAFFLEPLLRHLDRSRFEVYCYYEDVQTDEVTARFQGLAQGWRQIAGEPPASAGRRIRDDAVDILVDLSGHAGRSPVLMGGRWAPVQATYLGYPTSCGLRTVDYRITDWVVDPPGYEAFNVERPLRLPGSYFCYRPPNVPGGCARLPGATDEIVFASFNNLAKVSNATLKLWGAALRAVSASRLLVKNRGLEAGDLSAAFVQRLAAAGIDPARVELVDWKPGTTEHFAVYRTVDVALDTFPYNGATTTCEALWMGVPVVSRTGATHASRMGASILGAAGFPELAASSDEQFVALCAQLAADPRALRAGRETLRARLLDAPLTDGGTFARDFAQALEDAWSA